MKKKIIITVLAISMIGAISIKSFASDSVTNTFTNWGKTLKEYVVQNNPQTFSTSNSFYALTSINGENLSNKEVATNDIYMVGKKVLITKSEMELAQKFYEISGSDKETAQKEAEQYQKQENALYAKALEKGYTVTDEEVQEYLKTLKQTLSQAENHADIENVIKAYGSEDEYWKYMFKVYQKDLPIQKYVSALEDDYAQKMNMDKTSEEFQEYWNTKFEEIKADLVKEDSYTTIKTGINTLKNFKVE